MTTEPRETVRADLERIHDSTYGAGHQGSRTRILALVLGMGVLLVASLHVARCQAFFGLPFYDDEGYILLSLRQYARGAILYDQLYSQYGPAYFAVLHQLASLLDFEFTHTASRVLTIVVWTASSALCALTTYRLTRSVVLALCSQALVFEVLTPISHEPMHPGGLLCLMLAAATVAGTFIGDRGGTAAAAALGGLIAAAALTKANVGGLALLSAVYALAAATGRRGKRVALVAGGAMVLAPAALTAAGWAHGWVRAMAGLVAASTGAVVVTGLDDDSSVPPRDVIVMLAAFLVASAVFCAVPLARGTSLLGLFRAVVLEPARHPTLFMFPAILTPGAPLWAAGAAVAAFLVVARRRVWAGKRLATAVLGCAQLVAGAVIWWGYGFTGFAAAAPLLWVPLVIGAGDRRRPGELLLVSLAVLQVLHAYPVAGSHRAWGSFLFVPVGALGLARGWRTLFARQGSESALRRWLPATAVAVALASPTLRAALTQWTGCRLVQTLTVPLGLPGAADIRVFRNEAEALQHLTRDLTRRCRTFITMPGLNSLYLFTGSEPPTAMNVGDWMNLFSAARQQEIRDRFSQSPPPRCAVRQRKIVSWWRARRPGAAEFDQPLARYIEDEFVTVDEYEGYELMVQRAPDSGARRTGSPVLSLLNPARSP